MSPSTQTDRVEIPTPEIFFHWLELRTRNRDTDQFGHVNHAAMATLFEESRIGLVFAPELSNETSGIDLLVASIAMTFHNELRAPGSVRIGATVTRIGSSSLDIHQAIFAGGTCYASSKSVCVLFGSETRRPVRASESLRSGLLSSK